MIKFKDLTFKNINSYGNAETTLSLDSHNSTIIKGQNGSGKSTITDAICFNLFNKPYRSIKLGQLVNTINNKALLTTLTFESNGSSYKVIRGLKPSIFEIWKDGLLVPPDADARAYQNYLENEILGMTSKTFRQIVIIGSAEYKPFMQLSGPDRRVVIDDILPIGVFTKIGDEAKKQRDTYRELVNDGSASVRALRDQVDRNQSMIDLLLEESKKSYDDIDSQRETINQEIDQSIGTIEKFLSESNEIRDQISELKKSPLYAKKGTFTNTLRQLQSLKGEHLGTINTEKKKAEFYIQDSCPTCDQKISDDKRQEICNHTNILIEEANTKINDIKNLIASFEEKLEQIQILDTQIFDLEAKLSNVQTKIFNQESLLSDQKKRLKKLVIPEISKPLEEANLIAKDLVPKLKTQEEELAQNRLMLARYTCIIDITKDSGIKSWIIDDFIPIINTYINEYLRMFDLYVNFELDSEFNETIKSRNRDTFTYNSFSEGEKQRIDTAILFSWRKIAMMKNSVSTNLLIFDETLDSSLDEEGTDVFADILSSIEKQICKFVVSHRNVLPEIFDRHLYAEKINEFSIIKEIQ